MFLIQRLAEEKILAALERGELDNLPGRGKPLDLDDNSAVSMELRAGYRLLKNSGYLPPELEIRKEIHDVEALLRRVETGPEEATLLRRLNLLRSRLARDGREPGMLAEEGRYREKLLRRLEKQNPAPVRDR